MKDNDLRYGFLSTYRKTIFLRQYNYAPGRYSCNTTPSSITAQPLALPSHLGNACGHWEYGQQSTLGHIMLFQSQSGSNTWYEHVGWYQWVCNIVKSIHCSKKPKITWGCHLHAEKLLRRHDCLIFLLDSPPPKSKAIFILIQNG